MTRSWMPIYWGDYLRDTTHLTTLQHGAYLLLIGHYWSQGSLPNDEQQLANITKMTSKEWRANRNVLQRFFLGDWRHKRIDAEIERHNIIQAKRIAAGSKGGTISSMKRWRR